MVTNWQDALPVTRSIKAGKVTDMASALDVIEDGSRVFVTPLCGVPTAVLQAMADGHDRWTHIELITGYLIDPLSVFDHPGDPFSITSLQPTPAVRTMGEAGVLRRIPAAYSQYTAMLAPDGPLAVDVAVVQVSEPSPDGRFSLGVSAGTAADIVRTADIVIAEVNPAMPYTYGAAECERELFDILVEVEHPLVELHSPEPNEISKAIGAHAAPEIDDGAVLQFGIGAIPRSILLRLKERHDLGLHGGMVGDTVIDLVESGALTGTRKNLDPGKMVVAGTIGTKRSFDWVDRNPDVLTVGSAYSHGVPVLAELVDFTAVNSAIEVALDGSINAETAGARTISGPGGQPDFAAGAALSHGGRSIIAFPSTAARGTRSRIVKQLPPGAPSTVPRYLADRIVTEYGVAQLKGLSLEERAEALTAVAHPDFRADLGA